MAMETKNDCGPEAQRRALNASGVKMSLSDLKRVWDWQNYGGLREDLQDSPCHHFAVLKRLNVPRQNRSLAEILAGAASPEKTVILIHDPESPVLKQHWVVLKSVGPSGITVHMGDDTEKTFDVLDFVQWFNAKYNSLLSPSTAYEVGIGKTGLSFFEWLYTHVLNKFF